MTDKTSDQPQFQPVDMATLKAGMLVERSLYVYLSGNQRYIRMVKPLHPLEERVLTKLQKIGQVFSTESSIDEKFAELSGSASAVRALCDDDTMAPFEKNRQIRTETEWLFSHVFSHDESRLRAALFFFHRAFGVPKAETLVFVSDLWVDMYERRLKLAAVSGLLALWLGYSNTKFISGFAEAVFCEAVGRYSEPGPLELSSAISQSERDNALKLIDGGEVPGVSEAEHRFRVFLGLRKNSVAAGDELEAVVEYARWLCNIPGTSDEGVEKSRIARKLKQYFGRDLSVGGDSETAVAA